MIITEDDITISRIGEEIRLLIANTIEPVVASHCSAGVCPRLVGDGAATGLIALACAVATTHHEAGCEDQRDYLHAVLDVLFDQLTAFDRGHVSKTGETVQ